MKNPWVIIGIFTVVLFGGAIWLSGQSAEVNNEGVEVITHSKGNPEATVVLEEYSDLQCPACASFAPVIAQVLEEYGESVRFEYKHFPLPIHNYAMQAAVAAEAAGQQGKFFEFHDLLFENQQAWAASPLPGTFFAQYAEDLELDMETFKRHQGSTVLRDKVQNEMADGRALGVRGTPTLFLNGARMEYNTIQEFIEQIALAVDPAALTGASSTAPVSNVKFGL